MKLSGESMLTLAVGVAAGLAVLYAMRKASAAADSITSIPGRLYDAATGAVREVTDAISGAAQDAYSAAIDPRRDDRNTQGLGGWYHVNFNGSDILTQQPGVFIDPRKRVDQVGLIDP